VTWNKEWGYKKKGMLEKKRGWVDENGRRRWTGQTKQMAA